MPGRIAYLDGLRGVAISIVVLFHAYCRWTDLYPFGARFVALPLLEHGILGVDLFFVISGFVIAMSLERSTGLAEFLVRRWLRLFPAMLIASTAILATASWLPERPLGPPSLVAAMPGLSLIFDPVIMERFLGYRPAMLEGVFWSIFVEVRFYLLFGAAYFILGRRRAIAAIALLFLAERSLFLLDATQGLAGPVSRLQSVLALLGAAHFGWFAAGALFHVAAHGGGWRAWLAGIGIGAVAAFTIAPILEVGLWALTILMLLPGCILIPPLGRIFQARWLLFLGFVSYPLYLLHENMLVALIVKFGRMAPWLPDAVLPLPMLALLLAPAWLIARWGEPALRGWLHSLLIRMRAAGQTA